MKPNTLINTHDHECLLSPSILENESDKILISVCLTTMENNNTKALRDAASKWSLAGDKQLLDILQNIHQSLMTKCQEVNQRLDEMVTALDDASVDLQNTNNK
ncbi:unnamed protein product [Diatraea saccharalis]|uniref:Uncharacterized protein n=1 Tax=Diatraea saccharalis TaxID=40085 RepID=A0A9N9RBK0_9NEOP|nr:unnamed protein product [Diatraea saccharalis]